MTGLREHLLIICLFLVLVFIFTMPFATHMNNTVVSSRVDNLLNVWIVSWDCHALVSNPAGMFQANIDYPSSDSLAFSEYILSFALVAAPIALVTGNPVFAYNFVLLIGFALCGYTMYLLVKYLTKNKLAALASGIFFAFVPYHFSTIVHVHVCLYCLQPLLILFMFKYFENGRKVNLVGFGLVFLAQSLLSWYQLAFCSIPIALFLVFQLFSRRRREKARYFVYMILVLILCMAAIIPFAIPYFRLHNNIPEEESRPAINVVAHATVGDYFRVLPQNFLYDKLGFLKEGNPGEGNSLFPGFMIFPLGLLALIFVFSRWKESRPLPVGPVSPEDHEQHEEHQAQDETTLPEERSPPDDREPPHDRAVDEQAPPRNYLFFFIALGLISFVLSIGPSPHGIDNIFYRALHKLPVYGFVRFPIRYNILVVLSLAVIAGYACTYIYQYVKKKSSGTWGFLVITAIILLILLEFLVVSLPYQGVETGDEVPQVYRDLKQIEEAVVVEAPMPFVDNSVVFEDPITLNFGTLDNTFLSVLREQDAIYFSIYHWKEILNGMSGYFPIFYRRALLEMQAFPSPRAAMFLASTGVDHIVFHWNNVPEEQRESVRELLMDLPGLEPVRDYPDNISLYRLAGIDPAPAGDLDLQLFTPEIAGPGLSFNASLGFLNNTDEPFLNKEEQRQHLQIEWRDEKGGVKKSEKTYFYAPFFIEPGEGAAAAFKVDAPADAGEYLLTVTAVDGILEGRTWEQEIAIDSVPSTESGEANRGELAWAGGEGEALAFYPGEMFSLYMGAENLGPTGWEREKASILGSVGITAVWTKEGDPEYEMQQQGMLPCDMSPCQQLSFPIALQAPRDEGDYTLTLRLNCLGIQYLGEEITIPVTI